MTYRPDATDRLARLLDQRILVLDGAMGTMIQRCRLGEADFRGAGLAGHTHDLKGDNDVLSLTQPDVIRAIHDEYFEAGADIVETNTFNATSIAQADYRLEDRAREINRAAAAIARAAADDWTRRTPDKPRFVAGALGPTNRTASISPDVNDPGARNVTFDALAASYGEAIAGLAEGGADLFLVETVFDTLNAKAALFALETFFETAGRRWPVIVSGTITDASGRTLSGQTPEAFWNAVRHVGPLAVGLNCALGAALMRPYLEEIATVADTYVSCYPNAGLPNPMASGRACRTEYQNASVTCPDRVRPDASVIVPEIITGQRRPAFSKNCSMANSAALALSVSKMVSTSSRSAPPSVRPRIASL